MANSTVLSIDPNFLLLDTYSVSDETLIANQEVASTFSPESDYVEYYIYGLNNSLLYPPLEDGTIPYSLYSLLNNEVYIDPVADLERFRYIQGGYNTVYNFYSNRLNSSFTSHYFISEISSDRTEIRLDSNDINDIDIISSVNEFIAERETDQYYPDFLLNFGSNQTVIANNIVLDGNTVLIKLYEPLPSQFGVKSTLWVVEEVAESIAYNITFEDEILEEEDTSIQLKGPNINLSIKDQINNSTEAVSLDDLDSSPLTSSYQQLQSLFGENGVQINVDYTNYSNFIHFSSVEARLENFEYKLQEIESHQRASTSGSNVSGTSEVSGSKVYYENLINDIITNFDGYEYFLYFESGSKSWPKSNTEPPYQNLATTDTAAINWYNEQIASASIHDELNQDNLYYDLPEYLRNDTSNQGYIDFVEMIGQHFDNIWIYLKDISNKYDADNRIDAGVSKDLVAQVLRDFSLKIYQNNFSSNDVYSSFLGLTPSGSLFPFPNITGSLPAPSGFEYVDTFISSSTDAVALDDINKRIYKRLYHNLPYLFKSKGTIAGIKTLLNSYGVPDTLLHISEFGGKDKVDVNDYDYWYNKFNYSFAISSSRYLEIPFELNSSWESENNKPQTLQFRFKTPKADEVSYASQSLVISDGSDRFAVVLEYDTDKATTSGSFSGSIIDPEYQYADLKFYTTLGNTAETASLRLPFINNDWWGVQITRTAGDFELLAANKIYNGQTGTELGFIASASLTGDPANWETARTVWFSSPNGQGLTNNYRPFEGHLQEVRYYNTVISESIFKDYVMNPLSFEGNSISSGSLDQSPSELAFRATLGGELYTGSTSIHPKVTGSWATTSSFSSNSDFSIFGGAFEENREYIFFDQVPVGLKNRINDKIKSKDLSLPTYVATAGALIPNANTLSNQESIQQDKVRNEQYTNNVNLLEVTFSPQNEINDDIIQQLGYFNLGDLIGDPREVSSSAQSYPELDKLRKDYFLKYIHENYDFNDYVRLIKFFDNSLFKMIKDFVPARTSLASGITIKPTILERQKYPVPQAYWEDLQYSGSVKSFARDYATGSLQVTSGGNGGSFENFNNLSNFTQSWSGSHITPSGSVPYIQSDAPEFINGEFSGSNILASDGELSTKCDLYKKTDTTNLEYDSTIRALVYNPNTSTQGTPLSSFVNETFSPNFNFEFWFNSERSFKPDPYGPGGPQNPTAIIDTYCIERININKTTDNSIDLTDYIPQAKKINIILPASPTYSTPVYAGPVTVTDNLGTIFEVEVTNIKEFDDYYSLEIKRNVDLNFTVDYTYTGGSFPPTTGILNFNYFTGPKIVLEPYITKDFLISDCNPIYGEATNIRPGTLYQDIDYATATTTPVNFEALLSGSATKASVPDSNYSTKRIVIPRYEGSRSTTAEGTSFNANTIKGGLGSLPNVEQDRAYFAYFNWVGGTSPEWGNGIKDRSALSIRYFVDSEGNVIEPTKDSKDINLSIVRQTFTEEETAVLSFDDETGNSANFNNLLGEQVIFKSGKKVIPIIATQSGSITNTNPTSQATSSLEFVQGTTDTLDGGGTSDFRLYANADTFPYVTAGQKIAFDDIVNQGADINFPSPNTTYEVNEDAAGEGVTIYFTANLYADVSTNSKAYFQWYKDGNPVGLQKLLDGTNPYSRQISLTYNDNTATTGNDFEIRLNGFSGSFDDPININSTSYVNITQQPPVSTGNVTLFWSRVSGAGNEYKIQTRATSGADTGLSEVYGSRQLDVENSTLSPITENFTIEPGDEIRFLGSETYAYKIINVRTVSGGSIEATLDRNLPSSFGNTELANFLLRRYVDAPGQIIIEADKPAGGTSPGFFMPLYATKGIEDNFDTIIQKLKTDQLI